MRRLCGSNIMPGLIYLSFIAGLLRTQCVWIVEDMRQKEDVGLQGTLAFCTMMWLEFVWTQKVNVNGKQHRIYSSLRSELQSVMRAAHAILGLPG